MENSDSNIGQIKGPLKRKRGRPKESITDKVDLKQVELLAGLGLSDQQIGLVLSVAQSSISEWRKKYVEFNNTIKKGKSLAEAKVSGRMFQDAMNGNTTAQIFFLKNRAPERWKDYRDFKTTVTEEKTINLKKLSIEELRNLKNIIQKTIQREEGPGSRTPSGPPKLRAIR